MPQCRQRFAMKIKSKKESTKKDVLYWFSRILAILFIVFISMFALDVFDGPQWPLALFMHLIPSFILIILTIIAWKKELTGGILFLISSIIMLIFFHSIIISLPAFIIGLLFTIGNTKKAFK
jgi:hypothetical protein